MRALLFLAFLVILVLAASPCWSEIPQMINYEGMLTDNGGTPLDGTYTLSFKIYGSESGNDSLWWEHHSGVTVSDGLFSVMLGSINSISYSVFNDTVRYLGIRVDYGTELSPRTKLVSVPYAYHSLWSDSAAYAVVGVESDSDWTISGNDMYSAVSGNVGIGTTNPTAPLTIQPISGTDIEFTHGGNNVEIMASNSFNVGTSNNLPFSIVTSNLYRLLVLGNGKVGIGTITPTQGLDVADTVQMLGFKMPTGASDGYVLTSDASGKGTWQTAAASGGWTDDGNLVRLTTSTDSVGIGTDEPWNKLHIHEASGGKPTYAQFTNSNTSALSTDGFFVGINSSGNAYLSNHENQSLTIQTNNTDRIHITSAGKVGIGTTTPDKILHMGGGGQSPSQTAEGLYVNPNASSVAISAEDNTGVEGGIMAHNNGNVYIGTWSNHSVTFRTNNADVGKIDASGNFGIGTTSPQGALDVSSTTGAFIVPRMTTAQRNALTAVNGMIIYNTTDNKFNFYENGSWVAKQNESP